MNIIPNSIQERSATKKRQLEDESTKAHKKQATCDLKKSTKKRQLEDAEVKESKRLKPVKSEEIKPLKLIPEDITCPEIKFRVNPSGLEKPNFYKTCYCVKPTTTENLITVKVSDFQSYFLKYNTNFYLCNTHHLSQKGQPSCEYCFSFLQFKWSFIVHSIYAYYTFPPPILFVAKNVNYFKTFIKHADKTAELKSKTAQEKYCKKEYQYYSVFINMSFQGGTLKGNSSGKTSFIKNRVLGFLAKGIRAVLTIDSSLGPHYSTLPQKIFDKLNLATPLVIVNRAPSINNTCIYVVEVGRNKDPDDYTIHINPFLTEGLHADQDGDELSIFIIEKQADLPSIEVELAIAELKSMSWKYGRRHNFAFKSRYQFTQYHKYILDKFDDYFIKHNPLWASLTGTPKEKGFKIMELGCSTHFDEIDEFIELLINFTQNLPPLLTTTHDILNGTGDILNVVNSGAKGSTDHIEEYLKNIFHDTHTFQNIIDGFNKNITSSSKLGKEGGRQFCLLHAVNPLNLHQGIVYYNDIKLLSDVDNSTSMATFYYNNVSVEHSIAQIVSENKDLELTDSEYKEMLAQYT